MAILIITIIQIIKKYIKWNDKLANLDIMENIEIVIQKIDIKI